MIQVSEKIRQRVSWLTGMTLIFEIVVGFGDKLAFILIFTLQCSGNTFGFETIRMIFFHQFQIGLSDFLSCNLAGQTKYFECISATGNLFRNRTVGGRTVTGTVGMSS